MEYQIRLMSDDDIPAAMRLKDAAGWNQTDSDWRFFLAASPQGCFAAECDGQLIGTSATITYENKLAWIGMVIVDEHSRGQGIGKALLNRAIEYLDASHLPCMKLDATPQGRPLYEKFGFQREYEVERWMLKRKSDKLSVIAKAPDLGKVLRIDQEVFGADRSVLLRSTADEAPELVLIAKDGEGYALGRHGTFADQLGPWVARTEQVAGELLDAFLQRSRRELLFVDCLRHNRWAVPLVKSRGFQFSRPLTRMFRGRENCPGKPELMCAALGPEFG